MRLIDADALEELFREVIGHISRRTDFNGNMEYMIRSSAMTIEMIKDAPTIVEFEGDINKVIVKGEEYHKQLTTTWLGSYSPYKCKHCGKHTDSKTPFCAWCGRRASNYD